ncbi:MAG: hypothetical protein RR653_14065 [Clostridia bacterium]
MANTIAQFKKYVPLLDEVFQNASLTSVLESDPGMVQQGTNVHEIIIPKMSMDGLGNYDHAAGYAMGGVNLTTETKVFNYERGRMFTVDSVENEESAGLAFGKLAGEFERTKVCPEADAVRLAALAAKAPTANRAVQATFADGKAVHTALNNAMTQMDEKEVGQEGRYLFVTPTIFAMLNNMDSYQSKAVLSLFAGVVKVPQTRFYSAVTLLTGADDATNRAGGYAKATGAVNLNFLIVYKPAVLQFTKHVAPKVITPEQNQSADAWKFGYRVYGLNDVYENKVNGLYVSSAAAITA